jgi:hypothetical protein
MSEPSAELSAGELPAGEPIIVFDACVLYPAPLRDLLMWLATAGLFRARWSEEIHAEWMRNVLADRPDLQRAQLERTRALMDAHVEGSLVTGYAPLIETLELPDPQDLACAGSGHSSTRQFNCDLQPEGFSGGYVGRVWCQSAAPG